MNKYSLKSFALLWMSVFIISFLGFIYIILNLFFSDHITRSSLKDLKYTAHVVKLTLSEEQEKMKNSLALHVSSMEFVDLLDKKSFTRVEKLIENWKVLLKIDSIEFYNNDGALVDLKSGAVSGDGMSISSEALQKLDTGYGQTHYTANNNELTVSIQRKIEDVSDHPQGYLIERKKIPYQVFLEEGEGRDLIVISHERVVYTSAGVSAAKGLSKKVFAKGASAFELSLDNKNFDVFRLDLVEGVTFFLVKENLKSVVFKSFYKKYLAYFILFLFFLLLIFYLSYYRQVFKPLEEVSKFIIHGKEGGEFKTETSVYEISLIAKKLQERILALKDDVEKNKKGRVDDMSRLVASVAHELNNSLSYLGGNLEYLKSEVEIENEIDKKDFNDAISSAQSGYERIKKIVSDLRVFSSKRDLSVGWHSVLDLKNNIEEEFKNVNLSFPDGIGSYEVEIDLNRTFQIIRNLIINAEQAYGVEVKEKKILVSFYVESEGLAVSVKDWADGISKESQSKIFEPFYTTKKTLGGAGLGLSLSRSLAQEMNSGLYLQETGFEGSVFCFNMKHFRVKI